MMENKDNHAQRLAKYTVAAGAAGLVGGMGAAQGEVIYSGVQNLDIPQFSATNLDINGDTIGDILLQNYVFGGNYQGAVVQYYPGNVVGFTTGLNYATALSAGDAIDAAATSGGPFSVSLGYANNPDSQFDDVEGAFIGLDFPISGATHFGWIRVDIDNAAGTFTVVDWAYESEAGVGIEAGAIPEPGSLALLAAGAFGLSTMRRRRERSAG